MSFYERMAATALKLITAKGQTLTFNRNTKTYDPLTGVSTETSASYTAKGVSLPVSQTTLTSFQNRLQDGTLIETNLRSLKVAASGLTITPSPGDELTGFEGSTWVVIGSTALNPAGTPLVYDVVVKK